MKFNTTICFFLISFFLLSCQSKPKIQVIDFQNNYQFNSEIAKKSNSGKYQLSATAYSLKENHEKALEEWNLAFPARNKNYTKIEIDSITSKYEPVPAIDYIIEKSKSNRVVIINEAHHNASHRVFTTELLKKLYDNGYKFLGVEALANGKNKDSLRNDRNYPVQETGYYIKEPQFGNLIRKALEIGYTIFPYEFVRSKMNSKHKYPEGTNPREIAQAKNIKDLIKKNPDEKFLIYCGYDHSLEGPVDGWGKAMAGRLKEYTGIDPLTINQVMFSQKSDPKFNHPLLKVFDVQEPSILLNRKNSPYYYKEGKAWSDLAVFKPKTTYSKGRPSWLLKNGKKLVKIDLSVVKMDFPVMILAYKKGENIHKAIPVDIIEVANSEDHSSLALKKGKYTIVVTNIGGNSIKFTKKVLD